jgi:hypothetical protein
MREEPTLRTLRAWRDLQEFSYYEREVPEPGPGGDFNQTLFLPDQVIRVPRSRTRQAAATVEYESELSILLSHANPPSPLALPKLIEGWYDGPAPYSVTTRLPGSVVPHHEVRKFSLSEKAALGRAMGMFAAWFAEAVPLTTCTELMDTSGVIVPNRLDAVERCAFLAVHASAIDETLAAVLVDSHELNKKYEAAGALVPTIAGHDDLRPDNLTFIRTSEGWRPHGVCDFGNTQPSTPERELRHAACLGRAIYEPAAEAYQRATGVSLSEELIDFWAVGQASTVLTNCLIVGHEAGIDSATASMQTLRPDYDWSQAFISWQGGSAGSVLLSGRGGISPIST